VYTLQSTGAGGVTQAVELDVPVGQQLLEQANQVQSVPHAPQSSGQLSHVSSDSQMPSGQGTGQAPQSWGQLVHVSSDWQVPSGQRGGQTPQSSGQVEQFSPGESQTSLPHPVQPSSTSPSQSLSTLSPQASGSGVQVWPQPAQPSSTQPSALSSMPLQVSSTSGYSRLFVMTLKTRSSLLEQTGQKICSSQLLFIMHRGQGRPMSSQLATGG